MMTLVFSADHPHDLSRALARLERDGMLLSQEQFRGKVYHLPGAEPVSPEQVFSFSGSFGSNAASFGSNTVSFGSNVASFGSNEQCLVDREAVSVEVGSGQGRRDEDGRWTAPLLDAQVVDALVKDNLILRAFPGIPTHEMQSYRTAEGASASNQVEKA